MIQHVFQADYCYKNCHYCHYLSLYRLEISISRNIGTHSTRSDIAHEIDGMFTGSDGWKRLGELEYNVDYTLTPRSWEITPDLLTKDDEIKY